MTNRKPETGMEAMSLHYLEDRLRASCEGEQIDYLWRDYQAAKLCVEPLYRRAEPYYRYMRIFDRGEDPDRGNHPSEIIEIVGRIVKPLDNALRLTAKEIYVLLMAAYLHDISKAFPSLRVPEFSSIRGLTVDAMESIKRVEDAHAFDAFRIVMLLVDPHAYADCLRAGASWPCKELDSGGLFCCISGEQSGNQLIGAIAYICGVHKSLSLSAEVSYSKDYLDKFLQSGMDPYDPQAQSAPPGWAERKWSTERIIGDCKNEHIRVSLIAALLKTGDCLDITRRRIHHDRLKDDLRHHEFGKDEPVDLVVRKWIQFYLAQNAFIPDVTVPSDVDIVVRYGIPDGLACDPGRTAFLRFREGAEKDFRDQSFVKVIEYYAQSDTRTAYHLSNVSLAGFIRSKYVDKDDKCAKVPTIRVKYTVQREPDPWLDGVLHRIGFVGLARGLARKGTLPPTETFAMFPNDFSPAAHPELTFCLPTSHTVLHILILFERFATVPLTVHQIGRRLGIELEQAVVCCTHLSDTGYLEEVRTGDEKAYVRHKGRSHQSQLDMRNIHALLARYDESPYTIKTKIEEVELVGEPLPLEDGTKGESLSTGVPSLDHIMNPQAVLDGKEGGIVADKCVLVKGAPGTGKTTFGIQFLCKNMDLRCLYVAFDEDLRQMRNDLRDFGWDLNEITILPLRLKMLANDMSSVFSEIARALNAAQPDILVIDSINHLTEHVRAGESKQLLSDLTSLFKVRHITALLIAEDTEGYSFEEYIVDGIIRLTVDENRRYLEVTKMRGQNHIEGKHSYRILDRGAMERENALIGGDGPYVCGMNIFPNISYYVGSAGMVATVSSDTATISTGTEGLDSMLPSSRSQERQGGFIRGNTILLAGTPGSGKTIMGLQFLRDAWKKRSRTSKSGVLWISFESSSREDLKKSIETFDEECDFKRMIDFSDFFHFKHFTPAKLDFNEFVYVIAHQIDTHSVDRICVDSISDIVAQYESRPIHFKSNINSLCHYLTSRGVTTLFLYRVSRFFGEAEDMGVEITSMVDTILAMKNFEVHNRIEKGIAVLKIRGREHRGSIVPVVIDSTRGLQVKDIGWSMENLISGRPAEISEPFIFVKLFYENAAEEEIVEKAIGDFRSRYPSTSQFITSVRKPQIHIDYWSFSERRGPGHSNVKVFSISSYWAEAFLQQGRLHDLYEYVPKSISEELVDIEDPFWRKCLKAAADEEKARGKQYSYFFIPHYVDMGVLSYRRDLLGGYLGATCSSDDSSIVADVLLKAGIQRRYKTTFREGNDVALLTYGQIPVLFAKVKTWYKGLSDENRATYGPLEFAFAMPALSEVSSFVAFFIETLLAHGGDLDDLCSGDAGRQALEAMKMWCTGENGNPPLCGNPYVGDFSRESLFSRQWYSRISTVFREMLGPDRGIMNLSAGDAAEPRMTKVTSREDVLRRRQERIGITFVPAVDGTGVSLTAYDLVCLGLTKGSVSPETGWLFIDALLAPENVLMRSKYRWGLPARKEYYYRKEFQSFDDMATRMARHLLIEGTDAASARPGSASAKQGVVAAKFLGDFKPFAEIEGKIHTHLKKFFASLEQTGDADAAATWAGIAEEIRRCRS